MSAADELDEPIVYARVCLRTGQVLELLNGCQATQRLNDAASATPELFRANASLHLAPVFARLGSTNIDEAFQELVLVSASAAQAVQRLSREPETALLAVCEDNRKLGLMLSGLRERVLAREALP